MKNKNYKTVKVTIFLLLTFTLSLSTVIAQAPDAFQYQAVARDNNGDAIANQSVSFQITILEESTSGTAVFRERHFVSTNEYGLVNMAIGTGTNVTGSFNQINWGQNTYFVKIEMDASGGTDYQLMGTIQLLSVPYAKYADVAGNVEQQVLSISNDTIYLTNGGFAKLPPSHSGTNTDEQQLSISNDTIYLENGGFIKIPEGFSGDYNDLVNKPNITNAEVCNADNMGAMRYNSNENSIEYCNGANWIILAEKTVEDSLSVSTSTITNVTNNGASTGGEIINNSGDTIIKKGICWNTTQKPTILNSSSNQGQGNASFNYTLTGLTPNTSYYVRSYVRTSKDTLYGYEKNFTTLAYIPTTIKGPSDTTSASFKTGGFIEPGGAEPITERGIVYGKSQHPSKTHNQKLAATGGSGSFTVTLSGLSGGTIYYRAYAENTGGISYGPEYNIWIMPKITDIDGNSYNTVLIGNQLWLAENLRTTHYADGTPINKVSDSASWANLTPGDKAYCWYNNDSIANAETYGALYTWAAAMNGSSSSNSNPSGVQGICPDGWHLPSDEEWNELESALGGGGNVGSKLADSANLWQDGALENHFEFGTSGFTALPGGSRSDNGYSSLGITCTWWSSHEASSSNAYIRWLWTGETYLGNNDNNKAYGTGVRCVRDE